MLVFAKDEPTFPVGEISHHLPLLLMASCGCDPALIDEKNPKCKVTGFLPVEHLAPQLHEERETSRPLLYGFSFKLLLHSLE